MARPAIEINDILEALCSKSVLKQDVAAIGRQHFNLLKDVIEELVGVLKAAMTKKDERIRIEFIDKGPYHCQFVFAGDILLFHLHTNVFRFDDGQAIWGTGYLKEDPNRGYASVIEVYNFLADSFRYKRNNDLGYMLARIFINVDQHFLVQARGRLGLLFNDFAHDQLDREGWQQVVYALVNEAIAFDLFVPPLERVEQVSVAQMQELDYNVNTSTGKRLGFQLSGSQQEDDLAS